MCIDATGQLLSSAAVVTGWLQWFVRFGLLIEWVIVHAIIAEVIAREHAIFVFSTPLHFPFDLFSRCFSLRRFPAFSHQPSYISNLFSASHSVWKVRGGWVTFANPGSVVVPGLRKERSDDLAGHLGPLAVVRTAASGRPGKCCHQRWCHRRPAVVFLCHRRCE
jgi:hypothetical protein